MDARRIAVLLVLFLIAGCSTAVSLQADAGDDIRVTVGERPAFDGCGSTGEIVNYKWTIVTPSPNMPEDAGKIIRESESSCRFELAAEMGSDEVGMWVVELEVRDANGNTSADQVEIEVMP